MCSIAFFLDSADTGLGHPPVVLGTHNGKGASELCLSSPTKDSDNYDEPVKLGDLLYYRAEDSENGEDTPQWMVVTQGAHKRCKCASKNLHSETIARNNRLVKDPTCVAVAPALITPTGIVNKPDPTRKSECWNIDLAQKTKAVTKLHEMGYRVMCRDNYHVCLLSCRKYKKKLRARYCRMRMPRRPMEITSMSQLNIPKTNSEMVCTIASAIQTNQTDPLVRPLTKVERNRTHESYWSASNTDVLYPEDNRALVVDLCRLVDIRAMDPKVREKVVPTLMSKVLQKLPPTINTTTTEVTFLKQPYGFAYGPGIDGKSITITSIKKGSAAAKAGLTAGMCLTKLGGVCVKDMKSATVRDLLKTSHYRGIVLKFRHFVPDLKIPSMYHVKHPIVQTAAKIVGRIESFLGHTYKYEDPRMAETNVILAALLGCNTNVQPVGSLSAAMAVLQYLSGYLSKNPVEMCNFIVCILAARRRCKKYQSSADDTGTSIRNAKFLGQKVRHSFGCTLITWLFDNELFVVNP